ncbi:MAG TPA: hypothetical protein DCW72_02535 [Elusimicrobia bacterium]|nr:MAG: hypothetical protein A2X29_07855 [Elusimicrobia bacterium GWA2_64_40]OGR63520.1 MAG: hypothetical protein A2X30_11860 [Elusimicrobia bacterium GWB2_63_16]HAN04703.1 hypothetical protein [Elusimicrobiota bacterium]HAU89131.1 hypothetical protein [Elusimicrobiota bacterium]
MTSSGQINNKNTAPEAEHKALPEGYGTTEAALLPRDPNWMFIYWEITENSRKNLCKTHGEDLFQKGRQVIRVYDVSAADGDGAARYFDIPVMFEAKSWYVNVQEGGRAYCCEVGLVLPDGSFVGIVKTNTVNLPAGRVSNVTDEKWMAVTADFDKLLQLSGVEYIGKGSGEVAKSLAQRWEMLRSVFSRASSWGVSSMSSQNLQKPELAKKFWLVADCELILYGATEPDAFVTVSGRKVNLNPDGTFSMRFALPDGVVDLPVKAMSKDETDSREIDIKVTRATTTDGK